jgi:MFS family permease
VPGRKTKLVHARDIKLPLRISAYVVMLGGYLFYCYDFGLLDFVRPYLITSYGMSLKDTASLSVVQNIFITIGSLTAAPILERLGRRKTLAGAALAIGTFAIVTACMQTFAGWLGARAMLSLFLGAYYVVAVNLTVALFPPEHRAKLSALNSGMFSLAEIMIGTLGAGLGDQRWIWMVWLGAVPIFLSPLMLLLTPEDRNFIPYGADEARSSASGGHASASGGWSEMLSARWARLTLTCMLLAGLNFTGYQLFSSFVTLYLKQVRGFAADDMGATVALIGTGSLLGGFFWAFVSDRMGRRVNAVGFVGAAFFICLFLVAPRDRALLQMCGFLYGVCLSCTYPWGIWFTEIFPTRLRPYGAALVHGGHVISLVAPFMVAWATEQWGLTVAMTFGPAVFIMGAVLWRTLPETLPSATGFRGWNPEEVI